MGKSLGLKWAVKIDSCPEAFPRRLKPNSFGITDGAAEAAPFQNSFISTLRSAGLAAGELFYVGLGVGGQGDGCGEDQAAADPGAGAELLA